MTETHEALSLRETLQFVVASDIPAKHKRIIMEALTQALRIEGDAQLDRKALETNDCAEWQADELKAVIDYLQGKVARSWQNADEIVMRLATQLHRDPGDIRRKGVELGFGSSVDFHLAKLQRAAERDASS